MHEIIDIWALFKKLLNKIGVQSFSFGKAPKAKALDSMFPELNHANICLFGVQSASFVLQNFTKA